MSPERMRVAIAEACGWTGIVMSAPSGIYELRGFSPGECSTQIVPNYPADLNAMAEAEKTLLGDWGKEASYVRCLAELISSQFNNAKGYEFSLLHATAAQRAEAFLRTIGKWKES